MKAFVLEDNHDYQYIIKTDLEKQGHSVDAWDRVEGACQQIKQGNYDVLCIDIILPQEPGMADDVRDGGIRVLEELRGDGFDIPATVFVSARGYEDNEKRIRDLKLNEGLSGLKTYFRKPYDDREFLWVIEEIGRVLDESKKDQSYVCDSVL